MTPEDFSIVPQPSAELLTERQLIDYRDHREEFIRWLLYAGKNPEQMEGYARGTIERTAYRTDAFMRWVWDVEDRYTTSVTHDHADEFMKGVSDHSKSHKANTQKSLKRLFKWLAYERDGEEWTTNHTFSGESSGQPRDYLTQEERTKIREAALEYGSIPSYRSVTPEERDEWKTYLAQRFEKPKSEVSKDDWKRANGWKIPSLVWTSLDTGLRPIEVERAKTSWVGAENRVLRIPKEESSKNTENWIVGLQKKTATALERWLEERQYYDEYSDTDALWLTERGNPYQSASLRYLINKLCEIAEIPTENRKMSWYAIRHSVGTYMTREEDLAAAQAQLRHRSEVTTMKYDQAPVEERQKALERMG